MGGWTPPARLQFPRPDRSTRQQWLQTGETHATGYGRVDVVRETLRDTSDAATPDMTAVPRILIRETPAVSSPRRCRAWIDSARFGADIWPIDAGDRPPGGLPDQRHRPGTGHHRWGTSKLVDRIEARGHCRRRPNSHDGRSSIIELPPGGRRLLNTAARIFEAELADRLESAASRGALQQFGDTLARLRLANNRVTTNESDLEGPSRLAFVTTDLATGSLR